MFLRSRGYSQLWQIQRASCYAPVMVKPRLPRTGITERFYFSVCLVFRGFVGVFFSFSCPWFGKIHSAELHPLSYILSTTITPVSLRTSSRGATGRVVGHRVAGQGVRIQPAGQLRPPNSLRVSFVSQKTPTVKFTLTCHLSFSPLRALVLPPAVPTIFTFHQPVFPPGTFSCITASVAVVLSACSSLTMSVVRPVFKPVAFVRLKR